MIRIGVIGYGLRIQGLVDVLHSLDCDAAVVAICDPNKELAVSRLKENGIDQSAVAFYSDPDEMLDAERLDGVMIGTRCSLHTSMAIKALERNIPLFLEKPVATNMKDLVALRDAQAASSSPVVVSFPLRVTPLFNMVKEIVDSGKIGTIEHVQAVNNVCYGWHYYQTWYRDEEETQGLFVQKATHDFDYINCLTGLRPTWISAMESKQVFKGSHRAGLKCVDCKERRSCPESPFLKTFSLNGHDNMNRKDIYCCFAEDTGNEDSGSALIRYESGMHACYTQNFIVRRGAGKRGATLIGYKGTLDFDWYTQSVTVHMHHKPRVETHKIDDSSNKHWGGDHVLMSNFVGVIRGQEESIAPLRDGLVSALMCLRAKRAALLKTVEPVEYPETDLELIENADLLNMLINS